MVYCVGIGCSVQPAYVQYNINKQKGWKEQASKRQQKKERRQDWPGIKEGTLRPEWLGRVRVRRGEAEGERKFEHRKIQSVDGQRRPDKPRTERGSGI